MDIKDQLYGVMRDYPDVYDTIVNTVCPDKFEGVPYMVCNNDNGSSCIKCWANFMKDKCDGFDY